MLEQAKYINHLNEVVEFGTNGFFIAKNDLRNYEWIYDSKFDKIANFHKKPVKKSITAIISVADLDEGICIRNEVFETFERDILAETPGRLYIDDQYCTGYVIGSKKARYLEDKKYIELTLTFVTDKLEWVREECYSFFPDHTETVNDVSLKTYAYTYGYQYHNKASSGSIVNVSVYTADFILRIFGAVKDPLITIGGHTYQVLATVEDGERLEINSVNRTITLFRRNGEIENLYWSAVKDSYIFQEIEEGDQAVVWDGSFGFDLVIVNKRSEPLWI